MKNYTEIKGMFEQRRLVRLGKIRLGLKKINPRTKKEYPSETDYFVCPPEVEKEFGKKPKEIEIMIASADRSLTIPYSLTRYGSGAGVKCKGNKETANEKQKDGTWKDRNCPCDKLEKGDCKMTGHFQFIIPSVNMAACYQISTTSYRSIQEILNGLQAIEDFFKRPCDEIALYPDEEVLGKWRSPILMRRIEGQTHHDDKKQTHYPIQIYPKVDPKYVNYLMECQKRTLESKRVFLPAPEEKNPTLDPIDILEEEGITDMEDKKELTPGPAENKPGSKPEPAPAETAKEKKADTPPPAGKPSTKGQWAALHMHEDRLGIDIHKEYKVESFKKFSYDKAVKVIKELEVRPNKKAKDKKSKTEPKDSTKRIPETIDECMGAILSFAKQLGESEEEAKKGIKNKCGDTPTLAQLQSIYKMYARQMRGE